MASRKVVPEVPERIGRGIAKEETRSDNFGIPRKAKKAWKPEATDKMSLRQNSEPALSKTKKKISFKNKVKGAFNRAKSHSPIRHRFHAHRLSIRAADDAVSLQSFYQTKLLRMWEEHRSVKSNMVFIPNQKHNLIMSWLFGLTMVFTFVSVPSYAAFFLKTESNYSEHLQQEDGGLSTFLTFCPNVAKTVPNSSVDTSPLPSMSNKANACFSSWICSSVNFITSSLSPIIYIEQEGTQEQNDKPSTKLTL